MPMRMTLAALAMMAAGAAAAQSDDPEAGVGAEAQTGETPEAAAPEGEIDRSEGDGDAQALDPSIAEQMDEMIDALRNGETPRAPDDDVAEDDGPPPTPEERLENLFAALADEDADDASLLERRIAELWSQSGSDSMDLLLTRGRDAMGDQSYDKAIDHLTALVELAPDFAEGWNARATAYFLADDYWRAAADIQRTLALEPRHFGALSGLAAIFERTGEEASALAVYRRALEVNPHLESAISAVERLTAKVDGRDI
jgi:tetratricopeptide (TPR) repeat protein